MTEILAHTASLCPKCFKRIPAAHVVENGSVYIQKTCDIHGEFRALIWEGSRSYARWKSPKIPIEHRFHMREADRGCPFDCGLCPEHRQHTCTAVLEITQNCNLKCRFCFADSKPAEKDRDPSFEKISSLLEQVFRVSPEANLQISGGEPSLRQDLPLIVEQARKTGFKFIQLNTNGLFLARDPHLAPRLKKAGLSSVFLQFDGIEDRVYKTLRNRPLYKDKIAAVSACIDNDIGVILVPTLVPGINIDQIGPILRFGLDHAPGVRGVHFQPVSYFGRHGSPPADADRITLPQVLRQMETQTKGKFRIADFKPSACEHALCSFTGKFIIKDNGSPSALTAFTTDCCTPVKAELGSGQAKASVARHWGAPKPWTRRPDEDGLDRFIRRTATRMFSVSGMAFQDAWNLDLERLKGCCIHSVAPDGRLIPFCAYNLTRADGKGLYRTP